MPSAFNIARAAIYAIVLLWTIICLAIAIHFHGLLEMSDLTRFVPFAIFVCTTSLIVMSTLLGCTLLRDRSPISTRTEMACLGLAGVFWLSLGGFLATSDSDAADVECFASADSTSDPIDMPGFSTETYHAQYRVLEAFSLFNTILILGFLVFLSLLAVRQHFLDNRSVWNTPVTSYPWFDSGKGSTSKSKLPQPVTSRSRSRGRSRGEKGGTPRQSRWTSNSHKTPVRAHLATDKYDKYKRGASPRR